VKHQQHTTPIEANTTPTQVVQWAQALTHLHARMAPRFARPEPYHRALKYLQGILSSLERKNGWQLAEQAGEARPDGMQRLLSSAIWDADGVRDDLRSYALEQLGCESAILVIDESGFPQRGKHSAGVGLQYCGTTGQVQNCQVGVFLSYVTAKGHTLMDRELYLPLDWCEDRDRCRAAGIPDERSRFQTKPELAQKMIERIFQAQIPISWVVADTVYGGNLDLRTWLEAHGYPYVMAVACNEPVGFQTPTGRRREEAALVEAVVLHDGDWQRLSMSEGTKGPRLFDWAIVPMLHRWEDDGCHWLLIRRSLTDPNEKAYYFVFAPKGTTLPEMVAAIGAGFHIEEDFENAKDMGLDHYEVRSFIGWYRHMTLVLLALTYLAGMCATVSGSTSPPAASGSPTPARHALLPLTIPEVRHLLARLLWPSSSSARRILAWSWWRRCHQSRASYYHTKRRRDQLANPGFLTLLHLCLLSIAPVRRLPSNFLEVSEFRDISWMWSSSCLLFCPSSKGVLIMATLPLATGARLLGIHPKTLPHWLTQANLPLAAHPRDARITGGEEEHLLEVARLHGRPLQSSVPSQVPALFEPENEREPASTACSFPLSPTQEADQIQRLASLETRMVILQEQMAQLTLALLQERERSLEHRLTTLESLMQSLLGRQMPNLPVPEPRQEPACVALQPQALHPAEQLARSRRPALIEYSAAGIYVIISSQEGEGHLQPNSRAWFDWLATLSSFRFIGPGGRKTRTSRLQTGPADALLVGFSLCAPSYLQALSWHDGVFDACQSGAHGCQTPI